MPGPARVSGRTGKGGIKGATMQGHCHCGAVSWSNSGDVAWCCYCHCEDCRRNCAAPVAAFFGMPHAAHRWTGKQPRTYRSSDKVERLFCPDCGTPMAYCHADDRVNIHLYVCTLDRPETLQPAFHVHTCDQLPWFDTRDDLPRRFRYGNEE